MRPLFGFATTLVLAASLFAAPVSACAATTTVYPFPTYSETNGIATKHIFLGDTLVATVSGSGASSTIQYDHADLLGSTNVVTNPAGQPAGFTDYTSYGAPQTDKQVSGTKETRSYIGQYSDSSTNLSYLNARYYDPQRGQFLSEDPVFWADPAKQNLANPQTLNSYAYANGNPVTYKDPSGKCIWDFCVVEAGAVALAFYGGYSAGNDIYQGYASGDSKQLAFGLFSAATNIVPGGAEYKGAATLAGDAAKAGINLVEHEGVQVGGKVIGHSIQDHVSRSITELKDRLAVAPSLKAASSFLDLETANSVVNEAFTKNLSKITDWYANAKVGSFSQKLTSDLGKPVGVTVNQAGNVSSASSVSMYLFKSPNGKILVHTAFPD